MVLVESVRSLCVEPCVPNAPRRVWRDWVLVSVLLSTALAEGVIRHDVRWRPVAIVYAIGLALTLLWRRTHPLAMVCLAFGALAVLQVPAMLAHAGSVGLYTAAYVLLLPYSLLRWASGRDVLIGLPVIVGTGVLCIAADYTGLVDAAVAIVILLFPAVLGLAVRYQSTSRLREREQVMLLEREELARDLHDTVAHHVSAIVIRAQAGRVVAASDPDAAVDALRVIEDEASRALTEMRLIVGSLRVGEEPDLAPQRGVGDIERLADGIGGSPRVNVELSGDLADLRPSVGAALYRLAQESITNAVRHARHATRINVFVDGEDDCVRLTVVDDGDAAAATRSSEGYGLLGMTERAMLLGGTLVAGPGPDRGWTVNAVLPRAGSLT